MKYRIYSLAAKINPRKFHDTVQAALTAYNKIATAKHMAKLVFAPGELSWDVRLEKFYTGNREGHGIVHMEKIKGEDATLADVSFTKYGCRRNKKPWNAGKS